MNLLKVQDALKNASDQQLMTLMQAPDSTAPSYLVLSEIRRRKEMRAQQAPEGASNRTVAEELTAPEAPAGIRGLQPQMDPDGVDATEGGDVQGMAAGGIVRMQAGGLPPIVGMPELSAPPPFDPRISSPVTAGNYDFGLTEQAPALGSNPLSDFLAGRSAEELREIIARGTPSTTFGQRRGVSPGAASLAEAARVRLAELEAPAVRAGAVAREREFDQPTDAGREGFDYRRPALPTATTTTTPQPDGQRQSPAAQPPAAQPPVERPRAAVAPGIEGLRNAPTGIPEGGQLPTMAELMRQNAALFPDGMGSIRDRMREERVDPAARRSEAVNMALIEAGLRIAGSRNPSLIGAIGEGALPAVQSYSQQLGQIRGEQRQARQDELELAKQDTNRQFAIGQISAAEYRSRMDNINRNIQVNAQERGANARLAASESAADRRADRAAAASEASDLRRGLVTPEQYARMTPEQRENLRELRGVGRPADVGGAASTLAATNRELQNLRTRLSDLGPEPSRTTGMWGRDNPAYARWQQESAALRAQISDAEALRRSMEDVLRTGRGAQAGTGGGGQSILNYDRETRTLR